MKKVLLLLSAHFLLLSYMEAKEVKIKPSQAIVDTLPTHQLVTFLQQIDVQGFYGKPVDSFLLNIPANLYNLKIYPTANSKGGYCLASDLMVDFVSVSGTGPGVSIYVKEYTHMNRNSPNCTWDITLFRKEKIYKIAVWKNQNTCINGCCLE